MAGSARASHVPAVYVEPTTRRDISLIDVNGSSRLLWAGVTPTRLITRSVVDPVIAEESTARAAG